MRRGHALPRQARRRDTDQMRGGFKRYFWKAAPV